MLKLRDILDDNRVNTGAAGENSLAGGQTAVKTGNNTETATQTDKSVKTAGGTAQKQPQTDVKPQTAQKQPQTVQKQQTANGGGGRQRLTLSEMMERYFGPDAPTAEEKERARKRARRSAVFSAIGDGISAMANLYSTTKYAPNAYDAKQSLSSRAYERWKDWKDDFDKRRSSYVSARMRALQADESLALAREKNDENSHYLRERNEREKNAADQKNRLTEAQIKGQEARNRYYEAQGKKAEAAANAEEAYQKARIEYNKAKTERERAEAKAKMKTAEAAWLKAQGSGGSSSGGGGKGKYYGSFLGKPYQTKADFDKAVTAYAEANGIPTTELTGGVGKNHVGGTVRNRAISTVAAEGEKHHAAQQRKSQGTGQRKQQTAAPKKQQTTPKKQQSTTNNGAYKDFSIRNKK